MTTFRDSLRQPTQIAFLASVLLLVGVPAAVVLVDFERATTKAIAYGVLILSVLPIVFAVPGRWPVHIVQSFANRIVDAVAGKLAMLTLLFLGLILLGMARG